MSKLDAYFDAVAKTLPQKVQDVLPRIAEGDYRLMAIRQYVRMSNLIDERWAWTSTEEKAFKESPAYAKFEAEIKTVKKKFAEANAGYSLQANFEARNLETQTRYWNGNPTVQALGSNLKSKAAAALAKSTYPETPTDDSVKAFKKWLNDVSLSAYVKAKDKYYDSPTHATPGLSSHGRLRAIDFKVYKGKSLIAGTESSTIQKVWVDTGWKRKLKEAIEATSKNWEGPLKSPDEPWHWTYMGK